MSRRPAIASRVGSDRLCGYHAPYTHEGAHWRAPWYRHWTVALNRHALEPSTFTAPLLGSTGQQETANA